MKQINRVTISNIAELAGVSKATASLVLNGKGDEYRVSYETQQRILAVAEEHRYQPSFHARSLRASRSYTVGLVIPSLTQYTYACLARELESLFRQQGIQLIITCSDDNPLQEQETVNQLLQRQIDGLLVVSCCFNAGEYLKIQEYMPLVLLERPLPDARVPTVMSDVVLGMQTLVHRVSLRACTELYYVGGNAQLLFNQQKLQAYRQGLQSAGLVEDPSWVMERTSLAYSGYDVLEELCLRLGRLPRALITASFPLMEGILQYLHQHPEWQTDDLQLGCFDDHELLDFMPIHIQSIQQDYVALAFQAYQTLMQQMAEPKNGLTEAELVILIPVQMRKR